MIGTALYIRRNARATARLLLPLLAAAWLTAAAAPCAGPVPDADPDHAGAKNHPAQASLSADQASHHHGCPHCQAGGGEEHGPSSVQQGSCEVTDLARDKRGNVPVKWDLKCFLPGASRKCSATSSGPAAVQPLVPCTDPPSVRVALNIRYCVYLI